MKRAHRRALIVAAVVIVPVALLLILVHLPALQRAVWDSVAQRITEQTGLQVEIEDLAFRLWPARLNASRITVSAEQHQLAAVDRLELRWSWRGLLADTPRIGLVDLEGVSCDLRHLPALPESEETEPAADPWHLVEIGELRLRNGSVEAAAPAIDTELGLRELSIDAWLRDGTARLDLAAANLAVTRLDRLLELGPLALGLEGNAEGLTIDRLSIAGAPASLQATARITDLQEEQPAVTATVQLEGDLAQLLSWWDTELARQLPARGRLVLSGDLGLNPAAGLSFDLQHTGLPLSLADYTLEQLHLSGSADRPRLTAAGSWGRVEVDRQADGPVLLALTLDQAPVEPALDLARVSLPARLPGPVLLSGQAQVTVPLPPVPAEITGSADLLVSWSGGSMQLNGTTTGTAPDTGLSLNATLHETPLAPLLHIAAVQLPVAPPSELLVSAQAEATLPLPIDLDRLSAKAQLGLRWPEGTVQLSGSGQGRRLELQRLAVSLPGAELGANGTLVWQGALDADAELVVSDLPLLLAEARRWYPELPELDIAGGPLRATIAVDGSLERPRADLQVTWQQPQTQGISLKSLGITVSGTQEQLAWSIAVIPDTGAVVGAAGTAQPRVPAVAGKWRLEVPEIAELLALVPVSVEPTPTGTVRGTGTLAWSAEGWQIAGTLDGEHLAAGVWRSDQLSITAECDGERLQIANLELAAGAARVTGHGAAALFDTEAPLQLDLSLSGLELAALPLELALVEGTVEGELHLRGSRSRPQGELRVTWHGGEQLPALVVALQAALQDGILRVLSEQLETAGGPAVLSATVPLGDLPRPDWLWPDAPGGPITATVQANQLSSAPIVAALGMEPLPVAATGDLRLDLRIDPSNPEERVADLVLEQLQATVGDERLIAQGPLTVSLRGKELALEPVVLEGARSRIDAAGFYDLETRLVDAAVVTSISPQLVRALLPLQATGPLRLTAELKGPLNAPSGSLLVDHQGGQLLMRDPPVRISDLRLVASIEDGVVTISEGTAGLNRGTVTIGGGWNPEFQQGLVLELDDVSFMLPMGILSRWDGLLAIEPHPDLLAMVVGDLQLDAGLWDRNFDITGLFLGGGIVTTLAPDDPLYEIGLDLDVGGRGRVKVDNNLGKFNVSWDQLHVGGTAAMPLIDGELRLTEGKLRVSGREIEITSGTVEMIGDPGAEPRIEIVPKESSLALLGGKESATSDIDVNAIAYGGLAKGVGSVLGLENKSLRPADINIETESEAGTDFVVGQRLSRQVALFLSTDMTNVQDRTTMLQLWNLKGLPGLALQGFSNTGGGSGYAVIERLTWGGSKSAEEGPVIHRIRLAGDWPLWKWSLRRAMGLSKGQPYDPFLLFVASVRLERVLAEAGYQQARVEGRAEGDERLPTLVFECEAGPTQEVVFSGDDPSKAVKKQITALYEPPPLEKAALANMQGTLVRHLAAKGYPEALVTVERQDVQIVVHVEEGRQMKLAGPLVEGVPSDVAQFLQLALNAPSDLAALLHEPQRIEPRVKRLLHSRGFHQAAIAEIRSDQVKKDTAVVHLRVDPGPRERVAEVRLEGQDPLGVLATEGFPLKPEVPLDRSLIDAAVHQIRKVYRNEAYSDVEVAVSEVPLPDGGWQVTLQVEPGQQRRRADLIIKGLRYLRESLLRRAISIQEGELLRAAQLDQSVARLASFPPIGRISVATRAATDTGTDVEVTVVERPRWTAGLGARWTSERGTEALLDLRDDNLLHRGISLNLRGRWAGEDKFAILITELPPRPGRRLTLKSSVSYNSEESPQSTEYTPLREEKLYGAIAAEYILTPASRASVYYRYGKTRTFETNPGLFLPFDNTVTVATLGGQYIIDRFDSQFDPRSGYYLAFDTNWTGSEIGADLDTLQALATGSLVLEPIDGWTWAQSLRLGVAQGLKGSVLDVEKRFFAGGDGSIRGFERDKVGPVTLGREGIVLVPAGGGALLVLNEELRIPVWRGLRVAVFVDAGQVWESWSELNGDVAVGAGVGLRYATPIGPLWADVAWPVHNRGISGPGPRFYVGIGRPF